MSFQQAFNIDFPLMWKWEEYNSFDVATGSTQTASFHPTLSLLGKNIARIYVPYVVLILHKMFQDIYSKDSNYKFFCLIYRLENLLFLLFDMLILPPPVVGLCPRSTDPHPGDDPLQREARHVRQTASLCHHHEQPEAIRVSTPA